MNENSENKPVEKNSTVASGIAGDSAYNRPYSGRQSSSGYHKVGGDSRYRNRNDRGDGQKGGFKRGGSFFKAKKECYFSKNHINFIDYKNVDLLKRFLGKNGRILPRRITGTKMIYQRMLANTVKRARFMGLLPFVGSIWSRDYYEQQNREYMERKRQSQVREEGNVLNIPSGSGGSEVKQEVAVATTEDGKKE